MTFTIVKRIRIAITICLFFILVFEVTNIYFSEYIFLYSIRSMDTTTATLRAKEQITKYLNTDDITEESLVVAARNMVGASRLLIESSQRIGAIYSHYELVHNICFGIMLLIISNLLLLEFNPNGQ